MSIIRCEQHDRNWDSDKVGECPLCENEHPEEMKTDLEMTRLCAEAMGYPEYENPDRRAPKPVAPCILVLKMDENATRELYDPLDDDAQAMALVKKSGVAILLDVDEWVVIKKSEDACRNKDLNRAICECVAKMHASISNRRA